MSKKLVNSVFTFLIGSVFATGAFAQEEAAPAPKTPTSQAAQDKDAKAKLLERKRATQASKAAKAKAKAQEKQRAAKADAAAKAAAEARALDLNRASKVELKKLPGMTEAYADAIIAHRPYRSKADLVTKNILSSGVYMGIHNLVAAKYVATK